MSRTPPFLSGFKETTQSLTAARRPWRDFFDLSAISLPPSVSDTTIRVTQNVTHFRVNYAIIVLLILFLSLLYHPFSIIAFLIVLIAWLFLYFSREEPLVVFNFLVDDRVVLIGLLAVTIFTLAMTGVWVNVVAALAIGFVMVWLHAALRSTDDLVTDDLESPYGNLLSDGDSPRGAYSGI